MSRVISLVICALLLTMSFALSVDIPDSLEDEIKPQSTGSAQQQIGAFNGSIPAPSDLHTTVWPGLDIDSCLMNVNSGKLDWPVVQDFKILDNGSYLILASVRTADNSGILLSGDTFQPGDSLLLEYNPGGVCTSAKTLTHLVGASASTMTIRTYGGFHTVGPHSLFVLDDDYLIIGGTLGNHNWGHPYASFQNTINKSSERSEDIFLAKFDRSNMTIVDYVTFDGYGGGGGQPSSQVGIYPHTYTNSTEFAFAVNLYSAGSHVNNVAYISINGTTYSAVTPNSGTQARSTNILVRMTHNLSLIESIEIPSPGSLDGEIRFLESGVVAIITGSGTSTSYSVQYRSPGEQQWTSVDTNGCGTVPPEYLMPLDSESFAWPCIESTGLSSPSPVAKLKINRLNVTTGVTHEHYVGNLTNSHDNQLDSGGFAISPNRLLISLRIQSGDTFTSDNVTVFGANVAIHVNLSTNSSANLPSGVSGFAPKLYSEDAQPLRPGSENRHIASPMCQIGVAFVCIGPTINTIKIYEMDQDDDGHSNRVDAFPFDSTQSFDADSDGFGDSPLGNNPDECPYLSGNSTVDLLGCPDNDGDGYSNQGDLFQNDPTQFSDLDGDGYGDNLSGMFGDACPTTYGESTRDRYGCPDADFDGWSDENDVFPNDSSQWTDWDGDGYGDQLIGFEGDACPVDSGNSTEDRYGCTDSDGDGWSDEGDDLPSNPTQWEDRDGDGYGDNASGTMADEFPIDGTQWNDTDGDGHGDNQYGSEGDWFPDDPSRWQDSDRDGVADVDDAFVNDATQWNDTDGDGHGDNKYGTEGDWFPDNPDRWQDSDRDGVADEDDAFVNDATQWNDADGDGHGDELGGNQGDTFPNDPNEWQDSDDDGVGNNADAFPFDPSQQTDSDGDGMGDNPMGMGADKFPNDPTQWGDIDGDGYGDNQTGNNPDAFIADPTQHTDSDGDGYGDSLSGRLPDLFPNDPTQWLDQDDDGFGDNQSGNNPDPYLFDFDNDGYNDSIDILPKLSSPGDHDNDGCPDEEDVFPLDYKECTDFDGDGEGDNADTDDDNDGWSDTEEERQGTNPKDAGDEPVDSFEIVVPGTAIGLGAWDLIGIFGGVPIFSWILFGFVTRNRRTAKFERELFAARSKEELEQIALRSEYALMLRMIGAHQGIRLERLRAELDDALDAEGMPITEDQTNVVEQQMVIEAPSGPAKDASGTIAADGYEWIKHEGQDYYRKPNTDADWQSWEN